MSHCLAAARLALVVLVTVTAALIVVQRAVPSLPLPATPSQAALVCGVGFLIVFAILAASMPSPTAGAIIPSHVRDAFDTFQDGLLVLNESEQIVVANRAFADQIQIPPSDLLGRRASSLKWNCGRGVSKKHFPWVRALESNSPLPGDHSRGEEPETLLTYSRRDKQQRFFSVSAARIRNDRQERAGVLVTFRDVTQVEQKRADMERMLVMLRAHREKISQKNVELQSLADTDELTGRLNRRSFMTKFEQHLIESRAVDQPMSCVMVDNDHFKAVNDNHGHSVGDEILQRVAATLQDVFGEVGEVCRYGGEEFCIALPNTDANQAVTLAESARIAITGIRVEDPNDLTVTASFGVSGTSVADGSDCQPARSAQELIDQADKCLYAAKSRGRNQVVLFDQAIESITIKSLQDDDHAVAADQVHGFPDEYQQVPAHAVMGLVSALSYRDTATAEHSRRVANLCVQAASTLLGQRETYILEMAALLHDIGKIALPDEILQKPGPLTPDQWRLIAKHHRIGLEIIAGTFHHEDLCEIVRTHMAYYGGRSLIAGLPTGRQIPLAARLLTIADTYDVITSDRPHRAGIGHDDAVAELRRCAGTQFDPVLVEHFIASLRCEKPSQTVEQTISRRTALEIGLQIEQLAQAIDNRDMNELQFLATRLHSVAKHHEIAPIANAARRLQRDAAGENVQWIDVLDHTHELLNLCRATQDAYLVDNAARNN